MSTARDRKRRREKCLMDSNNGQDHKKVKSMYKADGIEYHKPGQAIKGNKASKNRK